MSALRQRLPPLSLWQQAAAGGGAAAQSGPLPAKVVGAAAAQGVTPDAGAGIHPSILLARCLQGSAPPIGGGFQLPASSYALPRISTAAPQPALLSKALFEELSGIRQHGEVGALK